MQMFSLPSSILARIVACAPFADPSRGTMSGVLLSCTAGTLSIVATDGCVLIAETFRESDHEQSWVDGVWIIAPQSIPTLKAFLALLGKKPTVADIDATDPRMLSLACNGSMVSLALLDGDYPQYLPALAGHVQPTQPGTFGINPHFPGMFATAWGIKKEGSGLRMEWSGRGFYVSPCSPGCLGTRRGLIMPIVLAS